MSASERGADASELIDLREIDQAWWQEAFRGVPAVRDLRFITSIDNRRAATNPKELCASAGRNGAGLLLLYEMSQSPPNSATCIGAIYDVPTNTLLATLRSSEELPMPDANESELAGMRGDQREFDAAYQAARRFERGARDCILALEQRTPAATATQPNRWNPGN